MAGVAPEIYVQYDHGRLERRGRGEKRENICRPYSGAGEIVERENSGGPLYVPGSLVAVNFERDPSVQFSHGFGAWKQQRLSTPELRMMQLMCDLTDEERWYDKLLELDFVLRWQLLSISKYKLSNDLWLWCLTELQNKAKDLGQDKQVLVLDGASCVCKSDRLMGSHVFEGLQKDTNNYLVSPWLYPFWLGQTPIKTDGSKITIDSVVDDVGGSVFPPAPFWDLDYSSGERHYYSPVSQWIATSTKFVGHNLILSSPINNLHAKYRKPLYAKIEALLPAAVRDWNKVLLYKSLQRNAPRIKPQKQRCQSCAKDTNEPCTCTISRNDFKSWKKGYISPGQKLPPSGRGWKPDDAMDGVYNNSERLYGKIALEEGFRKDGLQIYVEISNIEVTAENTMSHESHRRLFWELNGNRNERIVATTLICLRRTNIHPDCGRIAFRSETKLRDWGLDAPPTSQHLGNARFPVPLTAPCPVLGFTKQPQFQELGSVTLPEGRIVTFPNALQHRFEPVRRLDESQPGSLQFMAIHLVDPHYRVCSTEYIPPQSVSWWWGSSGLSALFRRQRISEELRRIILQHTSGPARECYAEYIGESEEESDTVQGFRAAVRFIFGDERIREDGEFNDKPLSTSMDMSLDKPELGFPLRSVKALRMRQSAIWGEHRSVINALLLPRVYGVEARTRAWYRNVTSDSLIIDHSDPDELDKAPVNAVICEDGKTMVAPGDSEEEDIPTDSEFASD